MRKPLFSIFILLAVLITFVPARATSQAPDVLFMDGAKYFIHSNPLEVYLKKYPGKRPKSGVTSSANWRGYVAVWEIDQDRLFLKDVTVLISKNTSDGKSWNAEPKSVFQEIFKTESRIPADWFTGYIVIPQGKMVSYVHMGYGSTFEKYIFLKVQKGILTKKWKTDMAGFEKFRREQFKAFKKTKEYQDKIAELKKERDLSPEFIENFLFQYESAVFMSRIFDDVK